MIKVLFEAVVIGIITIILGNIYGFIFSKIFVIDLPKVCKEWNKNYIMELTLFMTGFSFHIIFELTGLNKWYCKNYE